MGRPIIALLTDFGLQDHYVAAVKGVILGILDDVALVDITHDIAAQDILSAALELAACHAYFPAGTVFLVVVDPGVGTARRAVAVRAGGWTFVAPDNGVLAPAVERAAATHGGSHVVVELAERGYARSEISRTFEGRDRFAPAAAWLARGTDIDALGPRLPSITPLNVPRAQVRGRAIVGEILKVDRFGNLVSNVDRRTLASSVPGEGVVRIGGRDVPVVATYGDVPHRTVCALVGSSDYLEVAASGDSAAARLGVGRGARLVAAASVRALDDAETARA